MIEYFYNNQIEDKDYKSLYVSLTKSFKKLDSDSQNKIAGIYIIYNDNNEIMYIGQSKNLASRITTHLKGKYKNAYKIDVIALDFIDESILNSIERFLIDKLKPIDNIMVNEPYNIKDIEEHLYPIFANSNQDSFALTPTFLIFPKNKFIVTPDFEAKIFDLVYSLKNTEFDILEYKK